MEKLTIAIASDHAGFDLKSIIAKALKEMGHNALDLGCHDHQSVDYPDYANAMADALKSNQVSQGILICGTGIGISIAANRHQHVRAALCHDVTTAALCREHNDANVLVMGARIIGQSVATGCVEAFLNTAYAGGRHQRRVDKLSGAGF